MAKITIYHNPRCSKSRETLKIMNDSGIEPQIIEYLKSPPDVEVLGTLVDMLGCEPIDIVRKGEALYKELGFHERNPSRKELLEAMVKHPTLIERPIVVKGKKAIMGRPPENVRELM